MRSISKSATRQASLMLVLAIAGCAGDEGRITYVCEEPLTKYLELARENIANDYETERSTQVLAQCPDRGYHRRYLFHFDQSATVSKQPRKAEVVAAWCNDSAVKTTEAELQVSPAMLVFRFNYPWSTPTGKYPRTEFRLNRNTSRGGFFEDLDWTCELKTPPNSH